MGKLSVWAPGAIAHVAALISVMWRGGIANELIERVAKAAAEGLRDEISKWRAGGMGP